MDPSSPPAAFAQLLVAALPGLFAALFASASAAADAVPDARKAALRGTVSPPSQAAMDRYLENPALVESRWLVWRVLGLGMCAILMDRAILAEPSWLRRTLALFGVLVAYGAPTYVGMSVARRFAEPALPYILRALQPLEVIITPIAAPLSWLGQSVANRFRKAPPSPSLAESEVQILVKQGEEEGTLGHEPAEMIRNVLDFGDLRAGDLMVARTQVTALDVDAPTEETLTLVAARPHSRYPVYRERIDNIVGIHYVKDLITQAASTDIRNIRIADVMRNPVVFVPQTQSASSLLVDMRSGRRHHMAIVIDEFGGMSGVVTLEDIVEQIVGDIQDEHDTEEPPIVDLGDGRLMVDAGVPVADLSRYLGVALPESSEYNSLGGFLVERIGQVPRVGDTFNEVGLDFIIRDADERRVVKVEIARKEAPPAGPDSLLPQSSTRRTNPAPAS